MGFFTTRSLTALAVAAALLVPGQAQTFTDCNPLEKTCPPNLALGTTTDIDFTSGESNDFIVSGTVDYGSDGVELAVSSDNKGPFMQSKWYMMFGRVDVIMKAAPGGGVVSSFILQSDDLDEIDLEWVGTQTTTFQTNFFGKGFTGDFDRGENFETVDAAADFHTYSIDWNAERIQWIIDGEVLRTLVPSDWPGQYPQSPMFVKFGPWAAGDPSLNPKGVVTWSDGPIDFEAGPYTMYVQSITASDYSTGTAYRYTDKSGTWESIEAIGGSIDGDATEGSTKTPVRPKPTPTSTRSSTTSKPRTTTTSEKSTSSKSTPTSEKSTATKTSDPENSPTDASPDGGYGTTPTSESSSQATATPTGASATTTSAVPDSGVGSGKQAAWGLSLACALAGFVATF